MHFMKFLPGYLQQSVMKVQNLKNTIFFDKMFACPLCLRNSLQRNDGFSNDICGICNMQGHMFRT